MAEAISTQRLTRQLCLRCGICCNGVLFRDVELQAGDDPARLQVLGLPLRAPRGSARSAKDSPTALPLSRPWRLLQPCAALGQDCRCRVYAGRPSRCRAFECALFKEVRAGRRDIPPALRVIRATLDQADRVKRLLRELGDSEETLALSLRFQRMQKAMNSRPLTEETGALYAELTLAVHDLNLALAREFHP